MSASECEIDGSYRPGARNTPNVAWVRRERQGCASVGRGAGGAWESSTRRGAAECARRVVGAVGSS